MVISNENTKEPFFQKHLTSWVQFIRTNELPVRNATTSKYLYLNEKFIIKKQHQTKYFQNLKRCHYYLKIQSCKLYNNKYAIASIYLLKANNRNPRKRCEICSKLIIFSVPHPDVFLYRLNGMGAQKIPGKPFFHIYFTYIFHIKLNEIQSTNT